MWQRAATEAGNRIAAVHPNLLVMVSGLDYSTDLTGVRTLPVVLTVPNRVVYVAHDYPWFHQRDVPYDTFAAGLDTQWGYISAEGNATLGAPVFLSEYGTCHTGLDCISTVDDGTSSVGAMGAMDTGLWFTHLSRYLRERDLDWAYWPLNGSTCKGDGRVSGGEETFGLLNMCWNAYAYRPLLEAVQALQPPSQT
jgi:endoglucanase